MKCKLCKEKDADKKNTHYLTDGIIRSCLNIEGSSSRETGFYFNFSNDIALIEPGFQRSTSVELLEAKLGRKPTDVEIESAKQNPFSADNVFCTDCEGIFSTIESNFIESILPKLRDSNLDGKDVMEFDDMKTIRLFSYIQIWRTYICSKDFPLTEDTAEKLRKIILTNTKLDSKEINHFPLAITYLNTTGGEKEYTRNSVGYTNDSNPSLILMNDLIIQFYENKESIGFFDFHGLNERKKYMNYINVEETRFKVRIIDNSERIRLMGTIRFEEKLGKLRPAFKTSFINLWIKVFGNLPSEKNVEDYLELIFSKSEIETLQFSSERVSTITMNFILLRSAVENNKEAFSRLNNSRISI